MAEFRPDGVHHLHGLPYYLGANAVPFNKGNFVVHLVTLLMLLRIDLTALLYSGSGLLRDQHQRRFRQIIFTEPLCF